MLKQDIRWPITSREVKIIRARAVAHNEYNIVLKAFKYYYTKLCHKA